MSAIIEFLSCTFPIVTGWKTNIFRDYFLYQDSNKIFCDTDFLYFGKKEYSCFYESFLVRRNSISLITRVRFSWMQIIFLSTRVHCIRMQISLRIPSPLANDSNTIFIVLVSSIRIHKNILNLEELIVSRYRFCFTYALNLNPNAIYRTICVEEPNASEYRYCFS